MKRDIRNLVSIMGDLPFSIPLHSELSSKMELSVFVDIIHIYVLVCSF